MPQPYPETMTQGLRALCIKDQNHTEPPSNAGAECILNIPTFWAGKGKGREANQAQRKEHHSQRRSLHCHSREVLGLPSSSPPLPHFLTASPSISGMMPGRCLVAPACTSQLHSCLFLISGLWLHSIPVSPGATGTLQQLNEMQLLEQPLL